MAKAPLALVEPFPFGSDFLMVGVLPSSSNRASGYFEGVVISSWELPGATRAITFSRPLQVGSFSAHSPGATLVTSVGVSLPTPISPIGALGPNLGSVSRHSVATVFSVYGGLDVWGHRLWSVLCFVGWGL